jgi:hypothetical protein
MRSPTKFETTSQVRMTRHDSRALDDWRRQQQDIPSRPQAIREAIRRLVAPRGQQEASAGAGASFGIEIEARRGIQPQCATGGGGGR